MNFRDLTSQALPAALPSAVFASPLVDGVSGGVLDPEMNPDGTVARVPAGVTQAGDTVHIFWEGASTYTDWVPVNAGTAGKEIPFDIARSFIDDSRNRQVAVHYEVERGGQRLPSGVLRFGVGVVRLLPAPEVPDAVDGVFDPTGITGGVATVAPAEADLEPGDEVTMHVDGPNSSNMIARTVLGSGAGQALTILFPVEAFASNLDHDVDVYYVVHRFVDGRDDPSEVRKIRVSAPKLSLPAPSIREADGDELDPLDAKSRLTATVNYEGAQPTDEVQVTWSGNGANGSYQSDWTFVGGVPRDIALEPSVVPFNLGRSVTVTYEVRRIGASLGVSEPLTLEVLALDTSPEGPLPTPQLKDIDGYELDLELVANGGVVTVTPPWPFIAEGQRFWLDLEGTDADGNPHTYRQANGVLVNAQHVEVGLTNRQVPGSYFEPLADGSKLRIVFKVTFDGSDNVADAVTFPLRTYTVGKVPTTLTEDFESAGTGPIPVNVTVNFSILDITTLSGEVMISRLPDQPESVSGQMLYLRPNARVRVQFHFPVRRVRIGFSVGLQACLLRYYDSNRKLLHTESTPNLGGAQYGWTDYSRDDVEIMSIEITDGGTMAYLDNFTVET